MGARVLVIEDNQANMDLMSYLLSAFGHQVLGAADGEAGVAMARRELPDIVLCDLQLPKLDGHGVLAALRADPATRAIPVLAASAAAVSDGGAALRQEGFTGLLPKSLEPDVLLPTLDAYLPPALRSAFGGAAPAAAEQAAAPPAARVLVLETSAAGDGMVAAVLLHHGLQVDVAANIGEAEALAGGGYALLLVDGPANAFTAAASARFPGVPLLSSLPSGPSELINTVTTAMQKS